MWFRLMLLAFVMNGLGPFGLRVLADLDLLEGYRYQYLGLWYLAGLGFALVAFLSRRIRPYRKEVLIGGVMGLCSVGGQSCTAIALGYAIPGHIVFPVTTGGSLFLVAAAGVFLFRERVGAYGMAGIFMGITALILLSIP